MDTDCISRFKPLSITVKRWGVKCDLLAHGRSNILMMIMFDAIIIVMIVTIINIILLMLLPILHTVYHIYYTLCIYFRDRTEVQGENTPLYITISRLAYLLT